MLRADMVIGAVDAALEDREVTLNRVCVCVTTDVFVGAVVDRLVPRELFADLVVLAAFVGHEGGLRLI